MLSLDWVTHITLLQCSNLCYYSVKFTIIIFHSFPAASAAKLVLERKKISAGFVLLSATSSHTSQFILEHPCCLVGSTWTSCYRWVETGKPHLSFLSLSVVILILPHLCRLRKTAIKVRVGLLLTRLFFLTYISSLVYMFVKLKNKLSGLRAAMFLSLIL